MRRFDNFRRSRNEQDKLLSKICIYAFILLAALILFEKVIGNLPVDLRETVLISAPRLFDGSNIHNHVLTHHFHQTAH